jgi:transcriptional regulator with XRE-family HTH domain
MNFLAYLEELRFRASRCKLTQKTLAEKTGMSVATINCHLNNPEKMRLWELQKISDIIEQEENDRGLQWPPEGGVIDYERSLRSAPQPLRSRTVYR